MTTRNLAGAARWMVMPFKEMVKMEEVIWEPETQEFYFRRKSYEMC